MLRWDEMSLVHLAADQYLPSDLLFCSQEVFAFSEASRLKPSSELQENLDDMNIHLSF